MNPKLKTILGLLGVTALAVVAGEVQLKRENSALVIGESAGDLISFHGVEPVARVASANQTALTDNTGGSVSNATLADGLTATALTDNSGGAAADGTIGAVTAPTTLTVTDGAGTNDGTIGAITDNASTITAVQELAAAQNAARTAIVALTDAVKELSTKVNTLVTDTSTQNDNDAKLAELANALRTVVVNKGLASGSATP